MKQLSAGVLLVLGVLAGGSAYAQDAPHDPGLVEITIIPGGGTFFTESKNARAPGFGNYDLGGAVAVNVNRFIGVEGEINGALGISQSLSFANQTADLKSPHLVSYSGNLVVSAPGHSAVVPYASGGVGGSSLFERAALGINGTETFLTGNVGGGVKWYAGRWGVRGDYRFVAVRSKDDAPEFFGQETRYGHRVYGGLFLNVGR
jgi:hypothetical protein